MKTNTFFLTALLLLTTLTQANAHIITDESDLSGDASLKVRDSAPNTTLTPNNIVVNGNGNTINTFTTVHGQSTFVGTLTYQISEKDSKCNYTANFSDPGNAFLVKNSNNNTYKIAFTSECNHNIDVYFSEDSDGANVLGIWSIVTWAYTKFATELDTSFWKRTVSVVWPADGDYFGYGAVHITDGRKWDVVAHELGHAMDNLRGITAGGGGQHKIDECYSTNLAMSEGFASFFAAWLMLDLNDSDPKFEYMVPRRAPIQVENIPADVCKGQENEWRVFGFLWDVIDYHNDGESSAESFEFIFDALANKGVRSLSDAAEYLIEAGYPKEVMNLLWDMDMQVPAESFKKPAAFL